MNKPQIVVIDGDCQIAGRFSSKVAKMLLNGNYIRIVNAEKVLLSGNKRAILKDYFKKLEISSVVHPKHGPFHPRSPERILTRMIRGMIPRRKSKGVEALRRLRVYVGIPLEYISNTKKVFEDTKASKHKSSYLSLSDVALSLGWKGTQS